ncbi:hypothetical protein [Leptothermofonsia sp. ETS-13]|uniref:hypothetical protein n=1 Tax=Leptothermofonsia sp. ETS-13 TaxID=3035696 RepID=UPI003B9E01F7
MDAPSASQIQRQLLAEALQLSHSLLNPTGEVDVNRVESRQARLRQIREALKAFAHPICRDCLPTEAIPLAVRVAFVKAALLVTRYQHLGGNHWQGTLASPTLSRYQPDSIPAPLLSEKAVERLCQLFALPAAMEIELQDGLNRVDRHIARQKQIIQAVLAEGAEESSALPSPHKLFPYLFGDLPIPAAALDCVYTPMQIFFCLDYQDDQLRNSDLWQGLAEMQRSQVQAFLRSLKQFTFKLFQRFPVFGPCTPQTLNYEWCARLAASLELETSEVIQTLTRSVGIVPTQKAEAFLLHDIWGHHWQLALTQFESDYAILMTCDEPLRAGETAYTQAGPLTCRELFVREADQVSVDGERARLFFHAEVEQRLGLLFTHLIAEMTADVAEFKFVWDYPHSADQLLSSSLFKTDPAKLDLTLADVDFLFLKVLRPLLEVHLSVFEESVLEHDLLDEWARTGNRVDSLELRTSLKQAIAHLYQIFLQEYNCTYLPTMSGETGMFTEIVSNLLYLQNAINSLYTDQIAQTDSELPFQDLLIVFVGCYCSSDSFSEFWSIDNVLASYFLPCWYWLRKL